MADATTAYDKQKLLLSSETGHFSLLRALHLADLITLLNGESRLLPGGLDLHRRIAPPS